MINRPKSLDLQGLQKACRAGIKNRGHRLKGPFFARWASIKAVGPLFVDTQHTGRVCFFQQKQPVCACSFFLALMYGVQNTRATAWVNLCTNATNAPPNGEPPPRGRIPGQTQMKQKTVREHQRTDQKSMQRPAFSQSPNRVGSGPIRPPIS